MSFGNEKYSVQNSLINYVYEASAEYSTSDGKKAHRNLGWQYVSPDEALTLKGGETGIVFKEIFISQLLKLKDFLNTPSEQQNCPKTNF